MRLVGLGDGELYLVRATAGHCRVRKVVAEHAGRYFILIDRYSMILLPATLHMVLTVDLA